jgi:hypothetical protein
MRQIHESSREPAIFKWENRMPGNVLFAVIVCASVARGTGDRWNSPLTKIPASSDWMLLKFLKSGGTSLSTTHPHGRGTPAFAYFFRSVHLQIFSFHPVTILPATHKTGTGQGGHPHTSGGGVEGVPAIVRPTPPWGYPQPGEGWGRGYPSARSGCKPKT